MTGLLREWLLAVACAALAGALAQALAPERAPRRVCRLAGGLVLLLAMAGPLLELDQGALEALTWQAGAQAQTGEQALEEKNDLLYLAIIEARTAAYIVDKAEALGMSCQAEVRYQEQEQGAPCPVWARVRGSWTQEQRQALERVLEEDLGIPPQAQSYEEIPG